MTSGKREENPTPPERVLHHGPCAPAPHLDAEGFALHRDVVQPAGGRALGGRGQAERHRHLVALVGGIENLRGKTSSLGGAWSGQPPSQAFGVKQRRRFPALPPRREPPAGHRESPAPPRAAGIGMSQRARANLPRSAFSFNGSFSDSVKVSGSGIFLWGTRDSRSY